MEDIALDDFNFDFSREPTEEEKEQIVEFIKRTGYTLSFFLMDFVKKHPEVTFLYGSNWNDTQILLYKDYRASFHSGFIVVRDEGAEEPKYRINSYFTAEISKGAKKLKDLDYTLEVEKNTFKNCVEEALATVEDAFVLPKS